MKSGGSSLRLIAATRFASSGQQVEVETAGIPQVDREKFFGKSISALIGL